MGALVPKLKADDGMSTAEYAMGTVAVAGLGGLLIKLLSSDQIRQLIMTIIEAIIDFVLRLIGVG